MPVAPEMISKKLRLMKALTKHLEGVGPEWNASCPFDLKDKVFRGRTVFGDEVKNPFIAILEAPRQINPNGGGSGNLLQDEDWTLLIQGFASADLQHPTDPAYNLLAWVQMRMARITIEKKSGGRGGQYPAEWRLGGLVTNIRYQIPIVRPGADDVSDTAYFYMPISVGTVTDLTDPFKED